MDHARRPRIVRAAVLHGARDMRYEKRLSVAPGPGEVSIAVRATGLCGSDLHYYSAGRNGDFAVRAPLVLGHEAAGIVTAVGPAVYGLRPGARVAIEAGIACRTCNYCTRGRYNLCKGMRFASSAARFPHLDGTLQSVMNHPAWVCHMIPDDVSLELAALAEPLSVIIHAGRRIALGSLPSESVLVFGVGAIGLLACALARERGAGRVVAVDINEQRLAFAKREGFADDVYVLPRPSSTQPHSSAAAADACCAQPSAPPSPPLARSVLDALLAQTQATSTALLEHFAAPDGFDVVFECTGAESAIQMSVYCASAGGRVMLVGMGSRNVYMPVSSAAVREVDVKGSFRYAGTYEEALELLRPRKRDCERDENDEAVDENDEQVDENDEQVDENDEAVESEIHPRRRTRHASASLPEQVQKLVTHRVALDDVQHAFEMLERGVDDAGGLVLKVVVGPGEVRDGEVVVVDGHGLLEDGTGPRAAVGVGGVGVEGEGGESENSEGSEADSSEAGEGLLID